VTGNMADAEDVLQTVFTRLAAAAPESFEHVEAYLRRAAVNAALDLLRRRGRENRVPLEDGVLETTGPGSSGQENAELRQALRLALARIRPHSAEMFVLRYVEGLDNPEIARLLNTSTAVVAVTLFRIRGQLQRELRELMKGTR
jgi:RNA polymerase sigma-70 factor, ECF subfamily